MMADLVHEDMSDESAERLLVLGPVVEDGATVEPDHVRELARHGGGAALRKPDAAKQPEEIERALKTHRVERFVVRKILDPDDDALAEPPEGFGQAPERRLGQPLEL